MQADLAMRVNLIETQFEKMDAKLDRISNETSGLGSDLQKDIFGVRNDLQAAISGVRIDLQKGISNVRSEIALLRGKIDDMPSAGSLGVLRGRVESLPTTSKLASLLAVATIIKTWPSILSTIFIARHQARREPARHGDPGHP